jgi:hypothetical protein
MRQSLLGVITVGGVMLKYPTLTHGGLSVLEVAVPW